MKKNIVRTAFLSCVVAAVGSHGSAATLPSGFTETRITNGVQAPTAMEIAPDGRIFVCEQGGKLRVIDGTLQATPFVTLTVDNNGERGLLGVAFDPNFGSNHFVYVYHTVPGSPPHNRVTRFTATGNVGGSPTPILDLPGLSSATNHNGGAIHFGADGKLYVAVGENANSANSQSLATRLGKMLRINSDGSIPSDNPASFPAIAGVTSGGTTTGANRAIWAMGLRNPFTFGIDPQDGRIFIDDVGQNTWEEVNVGTAGANYGWPDEEGAPAGSPIAGLTYPIHTYSHDSGCAITGGTFYHPATQMFPAAWAGHYFFADLCGGFIHRLNPSTHAVSNFASGIDTPVDLKVDDNGRLYYIERGTNSVWRVQYTAGTAPSISSHPQDVTKPAGQTASFSVTASGTAPLSYQWQRDTNDIPSATSSTYSFQTQLSDSGAQFRCVVSNNAGSATSNAATLTVVPPNDPPVPVINAPASGTHYDAGDEISYAGDGSDTEDGSLPDSAFSWTIVFHHATHTHPFLGPINGVRGGTFTIPTEGETATNVWYRVRLTVTDSSGQKTTVFRDVVPNTRNLTIVSNVAGARVTVDGQPFTAPYTFGSVIGMTRRIGVPSPQLLNGRYYGFWWWSDAAGQNHDITTSAATGTYRATLRAPAVPDIARLTTPQPGMHLGATSVLFRWTAGTGVTQYRIRVGSALGGTDFANQSAGTSLQATVSGLPTDGRVLFVRIMSFKAGRWQWNDYRLSAMGP